MVAIQESTAFAKDRLQALPKAGINNYTMVFMAPYILSLLTGLSGRTRPMEDTSSASATTPPSTTTEREEVLRVMSISSIRSSSRG